MSHSGRVRLTLTAAIVASLVVSAGTAYTQSDAKPVNDLPNPYQTVEGWAKMPEGRTWGATSAVEIDPDGKSVWVAERCGGNSCAGSNLPAVLKFDETGKLVKSFGAGMFAFPHGIHVDRQGNVWVTDGVPPGAASQPAAAGKSHIVVKFSPEGKVLLTLGKMGVAGDGQDTFNQPSDVITAPNGDIFVGDGHGGNTNARIVKFDKNGKFIKAWGSKGNGPGQFNLVHGIDIDRNRRIYVADRANSRIQVFDEEGKFLDMWPNIRAPYHIMITADQFAWVLDGTTNRFFKYDLNGKLLSAWGVYGYFPGGLWGPHQFSVDSDGNVYVAESWSGRSQKFSPKPGADRSKLINAPVPLMSN